MDSTLTTIRNLLDANRIADALEAADNALADTPADPALIFLRGKILWRLGRRSEAMTAYAEAAELDPAGPARRALEHAADIADFFNPDILNP